MSPSKKVPIILSVISNEYDVTVCGLTCAGLKHRRSPITEPKYIAMYIMRAQTTYSMRFIGSIMGYSKTISTSEVSDWVERRIAQDEVFKRRLDKILAILPEIYKLQK
jgi:chromosomal replication initiation ATPase DnaA